MKIRLSKFTRYYVLFIVIPVLATHLLVLLTQTMNVKTGRNDGQKCIKMGQECQIVLTSISPTPTTSPTTSDNTTTLLPALLGCVLAEPGSPANKVNRGA